MILFMIYFSMQGGINVKNKILKRILCLTFILALGGIVIGCSSSTKPNGDPSEVLKNYNDNIKNNNVEQSYELLSDADKSNWSKDDYLKLYQYNNQVYPLKDFKIEKGNEYTNKDVDGVQYKNAVQFKVIETIHDVYSNKDINNEDVEYVVEENGVWKICRQQANIKENIVKAMNGLARIYSTGKGQDKDLNKAVSILNEAVTIDADYSGSYYLLGAASLELQKYDESISYIQEELNKTDNNDKEKSNAYNILGMDYQHKKDYDKAKESYNQAIQLDGTNQNAKTNLERVNKEISLSNGK